MSEASEVSDVGKLGAGRGVSELRDASEARERPARVEPPVTEVSAPFWEATRQRRLVLQWCPACDHPIHYPRAACPRCLGSELEWRDASGRGCVHAVSVMTRPANPAMASRAPYAVALVDLDEGVRMMTNVVGCDPWSVTVGMPVSVTWEELSDGRCLPLFEPRGE